MNKVLSICTAAYNAEKTIDKMLVSLITARLAEKLELIIVDDGSTDSTLKILRDYEKRYPDIIRVISKENGGSGSARNMAFSMARGKYIKIVDADDWVVTSELDAYLEQLDKVDADMIVNNYFVNHCDNAEDIVLKEGCKGFPHKNIELGNWLCSNIKLAMHGVTYKTSILKNNDIKLSEGISYVDMEYITLPIPYIKTVAYSQHAFYVYQIGIEGQSIDPQISIKKVSHKWRIIYRLKGVLDTAVENKAVQDVQTIIENNIKVICEDIIMGYILSEGFNNRKKLKQDDKKIKSVSRDIYNSMTKRKSVLVLRITDYYAYYAIRLWYKVKKM